MSQSSLKFTPQKLEFYCYSKDLWRMAFSGTLEKCKACNKTVYVVELLSADGVSYHKSCFKCSHCNGTLAVCTFHLSAMVFYYLFIYFPSSSSSSLYGHQNEMKREKDGSKRKCSINFFFSFF